MTDGPIGLEGVGLGQIVPELVELAGAERSQSVDRGPFETGHAPNEFQAAIIDGKQPFAIRRKREGADQGLVADEGKKLLARQEGPQRNATFTVCDIQDLAAVRQSPRAYLSPDPALIDDTA